MAKSPTQLSLETLRKDGWIAEVVEKWIPGANIRKDLWGWCDIVAIKDGQTLAVQTTSYSNVSTRKKKIMESDTIEIVKQAGWAVQVHGWHKVDNRWKCKVVDC